VDSFNSKRIQLGGVALAASLALAACGGGDSGSSEQPAQPPKAAGGATVAVKSLDGVDDVLVDSAGKALYASDVERSGKVMCVNACESFWKPLTLASGTPTAASSAVGDLDVIKRPDGKRQVTVGGVPLYRFTEDAAGKVTGDGFQDDFGGRHFVWSAVLADGKVGTSGASDASSGGAYDNSRGGYGGY
jgi:predicted lipoprotein with Yx(FWY)xxD motif